MQGFRHLVSNVGVAKGGIGEATMMLHRTRHVPVALAPHFTLSRLMLGIFLLLYLQVKFVSDFLDSVRCAKNLLVWI